MEKRELIPADIKELAEKEYPRRLVIIGGDGAGYIVPIWVGLMRERFEPLMIESSRLEKLKEDSYIFRSGTSMKLNPDDFIIPLREFELPLITKVILPKKRARWRIKKMKNGK